MLRSKSEAMSKCSAGIWSSSAPSSHSASQPAAAADYPVRPVTLVVAFTPGGPSDVLARIVGKKLEQLLGQPFVIETGPAPAATSRPSWPRARRPTATRC